MATSGDLTWPPAGTFHSHGEQAWECGIIARRSDRSVRGEEPSPNPCRRRRQRPLLQLSRRDGRCRCRGGTPTISSALEGAAAADVRTNDATMPRWGRERPSMLLCGRLRSDGHSRIGGADLLEPDVSAEARMPALWDEAITAGRPTVLAVGLRPAEWAAPALAGFPVSGRSGGWPRSAGGRRRRPGR